MISDLLFLMAVSLLKAQLAISAAIVLVFALRPLARCLSVDAAYGLWALVPVSGVVSFFPTRADVLTSQARTGFQVVFHSASSEAFWAAAPPLLFTTWLGGAAVFIAVLTLSERQFRRLAQRGAAGPAVVGVGWMRLVTPHDYETQFTPVERDFVRRHERAHMMRDDPLANLLIVVIQVISWFNPLVYLAAPAARIDQELACDQAVVRHGPDCRRAYAATLLKAQLIGRLSPLACAWAPLSRHPLELRMRRLAQRPDGLVRRYLGGATVVAAGVVLTFAVWSGEPQCVLRSPVRTVPLSGSGLAAFPRRVPRPPFFLLIKTDPSASL